MPRGGKRAGAGTPKRFDDLHKKQYLLEGWMIERIKQEAQQRRQSESEVLRDLLGKTLKEPG